MKALLRGSLATLVGSVMLLVAPAAFAEGEACLNDTDCPNPACGGDVCNWAKPAIKPEGDKMYYCQPAGKAPKGSDGWCTTVDNCKCKGSGATCVAPYCTFTVDPAAAGGGGSAAGGMSSAGGSAPAAGSGGSATAGTTSTAGAAGMAATSDSGGCSVGVPGGAGTGVAAALGALGLGLAFARRRR